MENWPIYLKKMTLDHMYLWPKSTMGMFASTFSTASAASNVTKAKLFGGALIQTSVTFRKHRSVHEILSAVYHKLGRTTDEALTVPYSSNSSPRSFGLQSSGRVLT